LGAAPLEVTELPGCSTATQIAVTVIVVPSSHQE
jgi:hypothetical protein